MAFHAFVVCNGLVNPLLPLFPPLPLLPLLSSCPISLSPPLPVSFTPFVLSTPPLSPPPCSFVPLSYILLLYSLPHSTPSFHPPPPFVQNGLWGTVDRGSSSRDPLVTYPCPAGYCRCFVRTIKGPQTCDYVLDSENFNRQCSCDREGQCVCCMCLCV